MRRPVLLLTAFLLLLAVAGVTVYGLSARHRSLGELEATLARLDGEGYGRSALDLYAAAPDLDPGRQARAWAWATRDRPTSRPAVGRDWYAKGEVEPDPRVTAWRAATLPEMNELRALLAEGPVCLTALGWPPEGLASDEWRPLSERMPRSPNLLALRQAFDFFGLEALLADDPAGPLETLGRLHESTAHPGTLIDGMIAVACDAMRDETYLQLARSGGLTSAALEGWVSEPPRASRLAADAFRGERLGFLAPVYEGILRGKTFSSAVGEGNDGSFADVLRDAHSWATEPAHLAKIVAAEAALEGYLRGTLDEAAALRAWNPLDRLPETFRLCVVNYEAIVYQAHVVSTAHRSARAAARLATRGRLEGRVPSSEVEARAWLAEHGALFDAGRLGFPLRYEKLGPGRFRLARDPSAEIPALIRETYAQQLARTTLGTPSSGRSLHIQGDVVEVEVALP